MLPFFKKSYPYNPLSLKDTASSFFVGCFVAFFLLAFQPFGISVWETEYRFIKILGFGLVSFLCPVIYKVLVVILVRRTKPEETWVVWKEILTLVFALLFIAVGNLVYGKLIGITSIGVTQLLFAVAATFLLGIFPIVANVAIKYNRFVVLNQQEARQLEEEVKDYQLRLEKREEMPKQKETEIQKQSIEEEIAEPQSEPEEQKDKPEADKLILIAENEKDKLELRAPDLLYMESADNYSEIVFLKNGVLSKELIRASLKRIESQITFPYIIRCHRGYIVNLKQVDTVKGNAQGYKINFKMGSANQIPVSRNYGKLLFERMEALT